MCVGGGLNNYSLTGGAACKIERSSGDVNVGGLECRMVIKRLQHILHTVANNEKKRIENC